MGSLHVFEVKHSCGCVRSYSEEIDPAAFCCERVGIVRLLTAVKADLASRDCFLCGPLGEGRRIRLLREAVGLSRDGLGRAMGKTETWMADVEYGDVRITKVTRARLAGFLTLAVFHDQPAAVRAG